MRELTFGGFLTSYVKSLSLYDTMNMRVLTAEAAGENPRLREPLVLYALVLGKVHLLRSALASLETNWDPEAILTAYEGHNIGADLAEDVVSDREYQKVWRSFMARKNRLCSENEVKALIREKVTVLCGEYGLSRYRIYTDLRLNPGNLNAWLKYGTSEKVSLETARNVLRYVKSCAK